MKPHLPTFDTARLLLRPRSMAEFDGCLAMDRDPQVTQYVAGPWHDPQAHERFLSERIQRPFEPGFGYWSIFVKDAPATFLGWILLIPVDGVGPEIEIGWRLNRTAWGRGYATEAATPIVEHAFRDMRLQQIVAGIHPENIGSIRVAEKLGLKFVDGDGTHADESCRSYRMTQDEFRARYGI
ncbi:Protein N-acetyltransferase, RimJ/RimL family [Paraburkholderia phenazinium]|uniref:Protein N-acetyltransferase, RimJ/RimL family n=1 Tax=Paraburkholderia phenazinium TaxID=60549 RepID=A0A1G8IM95_9BURK|nr:GNAT family N-acetyltransferase [Paraburkholderia phenazinium]SDI19630.1 Protein N-acetyltransferase, RimJ/RimL family [Paraburkholderia phenazinium]